MKLNTVSSTKSIDPFKPFNLMNDEEIIETAKSGNSLALEFLMEKYKNFVFAKAKNYFLVGAEKDDIIQEGLIGLFKAIRDFNVEKLSSFHSFADLCITRQIITAIKTTTRQKHIPLNFYVSLNKPILNENYDTIIMDYLEGEITNNPEDIIINNLNLTGMENEIIEILSNFEWEIMSSYLDGNTYQEIAKKFRKEIKSVDNALQRGKYKLEKKLEKKS